MDRKKQITIAAKLLRISEDEAEKYSHSIDGITAIYVSVPTKGGDSLIISESGDVLYANSSIGFNTHLREFLNGRRTPLDAFDI